jgi:hypothetical protein
LQGIHTYTKSLIVGHQHFKQNGFLGRSYNVQTLFKWFGSGKNAFAARIKLGAIGKAFNAAIVVSQVNPLVLVRFYLYIYFVACLCQNIKRVENTKNCYQMKFRFIHRTDYYNSKEKIQE